MIPPPMMTKRACAGGPRPPWSGFRSFSDLRARAISGGFLIGAVDFLRDTDRLGRYADSRPRRGTPRSAVSAPRQRWLAAHSQLQVRRCHCKWNAAHVTPELPRQPGRGDFGAVAQPGRPALYRAENEGRKSRAHRRQEVDGADQKAA